MPQVRENQPRMDLPRLIAALSEPAAYPFEVQTVTVCQTHISAVFLAGFHRTAESNAASAVLGSFPAVSRNLLDIFKQSEPQVGTTVSLAVFTRLRTLTEEALARCRSLIDSRADRGMTRDCHGDLHL